MFTRIHVRAHARELEVIAPELEVHTHGVTSCSYRALEHFKKMFAEKFRVRFNKSRGYPNPPVKVWVLGDRSFSQRMKCSGGVSRALWTRRAVTHPAVRLYQRQQNCASTSRADLRFKTLRLLKVRNPRRDGFRQAETLARNFGQLVLRMETLKCEF